MCHGVLYARGGRTRSTEGRHPHETQTKQQQQHQHTTNTTHKRPPETAKSKNPFLFAATRHLRRLFALERMGRWSGCARPNAPQRRSGLRFGSKTKTAAARAEAKEEAVTEKVKMCTTSREILQQCAFLVDARRARSRGVHREKKVPLCSGRRPVKGVADN